ncbi:hypothetical protein CH370_01910 [Leptospira kmetyi]|nr:hypothetical protein CH370_01910 [Leptospira kmetyi]
MLLWNSWIRFLTLIKRKALEETPIRILVDRSFHSDILLRTILLKKGYLTAILVSVNEISVF